MLKLIKKLFEVGIVYNVYTEEVVYKSRSIRKCIDKLYELEEVSDEYGIRYRGHTYYLNDDVYVNLYDLFEQEYMK